MIFIFYYCGNFNLNSKENKVERKVWKSLTKLIDYINSEEFKGYDPYDALNSKILANLSFNNRILKLVYTQTLKRLPINLRPLLGIRKGYNPKGLGLFLSSYLKLYSVYRTNNYLQTIENIISLLEKARCTGYSGHCWGFNFDWQSETFLIKKGTPTIVNTTFIAHALLDAYEIFGEDHFFEMARSSCNFILHDLYIFKCDGTICFSYNPLDRSKIHNANVLGAGLLARVYSINKEDKLLDFAGKAVSYTINRQNENGSWYYGESRQEKGYWQKGENGTEYQKDVRYRGNVSYIDSYHTGFVLENISDFMKFIGDYSHIETIKKGVDFYENNFFLEDGTPKYFYDRTYPIDIHSSAQAIITFSKLKDISNRNHVLEGIVHWMIDNMQDRRGQFYFRKGRVFKNKIPFIRWSQAWAFNALTTYCLHLNKNIGNDRNDC